MKARGPRARFYGVYRPLAMGMTEVRAASGVPASPPGNWWSRTITPQGEIQHSEVPVSRNWSHAIGGGPIRKTARFWSHDIGANPDKSELRPMGLDPSSYGSIKDTVEELTGSTMAGDMVACVVNFVSPRTALPLMWLWFIGLGFAVYWWQKKKETEKNKAIAYGVATWVGVPLVWCYLGHKYPLGSW